LLYINSSYRFLQCRLLQLTVYGRCLKNTAARLITGTRRCDHITVSGEESTTKGMLGAPVVVWSCTEILCW